MYVYVNVQYIRTFIPYTCTSSSVMYIRTYVCTYICTVHSYRYYICIMYAYSTYYVCALLLG